MSFQGEELKQRRRDAALRWYYKHKDVHKARQKLYKEQRPDRYRDVVRKCAAKRMGFEPPPREVDCPPKPQVCDCCAESFRRKNEPHLDHCHATGKFLGWVCNACNTKGDDIERLEARLVYLKRRLI